MGVLYIIEYSVDGCETTEMAVLYVIECRTDWYHLLEWGSSMSSSAELTDIL